LEDEEAKTMKHFQSATTGDKIIQKPEDGAIALAVKLLGMIKENP
jgi:hypothetical protein